MPPLPFGLSWGLIKLVGIGVLLGLVVLFYFNWQSSVHNTGVWQERYRTEFNTKEGFRTQLRACNTRITSTADEGTKSYDRCQNLAKSSVTEAYDQGVLFGRNLCPKLTCSQ